MLVKIHVPKLWSVVVFCVLVWIVLWMANHNKRIDDNYMWRWQHSNRHRSDKAIEQYHKDQASKPPA